MVLKKLFIFKKPDQSKPVKLKKFRLGGGKGYIIATSHGRNGNRAAFMFKDLNTPQYIMSSLRFQKKVMF